MATHPTEHAETARTVLRMLAKTTRRVEDPSQLYAVIDDLRGGVQALHTTVAQLADAHTAHQDRAISRTGDPAAGRTAAAEAHAALREAAHSLDGVEKWLRAAADRTDHVDWTPAPAAPSPVVEEVDPAQALTGLSEHGFWRTVTLQEGKTAKTTMRLLAEHGAEAAVAYLAQADHGDPEIVRELTRGYAYDEPPGGRERVFKVGAYLLSIVPDGRWVGLSHWDEPSAGPTLAPPPPPALRPAAAARGTARTPDQGQTPVSPDTGQVRHHDPARPATRSRADASWFERPGHTAGRQGPGRGL